MEFEKLAEFILNANVLPKVDKTYYSKKFIFCEWKNQNKVRSSIRIKLVGNNAPEEILIMIYCFHLTGNIKSWYHKKMYSFPPSISDNPKILENFQIALNFAFIKAGDIKHKDLTLSKKINW